MRQSKTLKKSLLTIAVLAAVALFFALGLDRYLTFDFIRAKHAEIEGLYHAKPALVIGAYFLIYVLVTSLSLPGALIMTLIGGAIFGVVVGTITISFASTLGATLALLVSRYILRDWVEAKFSDRITTINNGLKKDGPLYLFTLRLTPLVPFFVTNLAMGITRFPVSKFFWISQLGMLPGTIVYVNAGTQLATIQSPGDIVSPRLVLALTLLAVFPLIANSALRKYKASRRMKKFKKPRKYDYDLVVIGAGSAGLVASYIAAAVKAKVALVERNKMGGDCLNTGCVPSKALIRSAKILDNIRRAKVFGIRDASAEFEFADIMERIQHVIRQIEPHDSVERYTGLGVECIQGEARIQTPYEVLVGHRTLITRNIVIATGGGPITPKIQGIELIPSYTSDTIWDLRTKPKRLVVLGGGPIGCELAQAFRRLDIEVTLIEKGARLVPREDNEVSTLLLEKFQKEGIQVLLNHEVVRVEKAGSASQVVIRATLANQASGGDSEIRIEGDAFLLALGRKAVTSGLGLENLGISTTEKGTVEIDEYLRTIYPNIFVCGDVAGPFQFTHTASHQAWYAAVNALFRPFRQFKADYRVIPWCTYTDPEIARVGLSESEAMARQIPYLVSTYGIDELDRALCDGEAHGFVKVLTRPGSDQILGVTICSHRAGDLIAEFVLAMKHKIGLGKILGTIHIYPTLAEANKYAAGAWKRQTAPQGALKWLERFHSFRRG